MNPTITYWEYAHIDVHEEYVVHSGVYDIAKYAIDAAKRLHNKTKRQQFVIRLNVDQDGNRTTETVAKIGD